MAVQKQYILLIRNALLIFVALLSLASCAERNDQVGQERYFKGGIAKYNRLLTDVIVADIFTPPVASRIYAYSNVAAYECARYMDQERPSLAGQVNGLDSLPQPESTMAYSYPLASLVAFTRVAENLVFDRERIEKLRTSLLKEVEDVGMESETYRNSVDFGQAMGDRILEWAKKDGYNQRTSLPRYSVSEDPGRWRPTPPDYLEAIEPHWSTMRPFVMDSASQFDPGFPTSFDSAEGSPFYKEAMEVYGTVLQLTPEQLDIAKFWDCNPNISHTKGHVMFFQQQISPGGHWIHITAQILDEKALDFAAETAVMTRVTMTLADAFISCWDQKFKSGLTRPETYINKYIDPDWKPILQTPAFPEHTSGHSVASTSAATILTHLFGENHTFIDSTEIPYGLPARKFPGFLAASREAAISRLYGGIHYRPAIEKGKIQGEAVANFVIKKIDMGDELN